MRAYNTKSAKAITHARYLWLTDLYHVKKTLQNTSVRLKLLFWFRSDTETETQIGRYVLSANTVTDTKLRENLGTDSMRYFFHHKRAPKIKFSSKHYILLNYFWRARFIFKLIKTCISPRIRKNCVKFEKFQMNLDDF